MRPNSVAGGATVTIGFAARWQTASLLFTHLQKVIDRDTSCIYINCMDIEFDPAKSEANLAKHGVALTFGARIFGDDAHIVISSIRPIDGEERFKVVGLVDGNLWTGVHVLRGTALRFISVRRSNDGERRIYDRA